MPLTLTDDQILNLNLIGELGLENLAEEEKIKMIAQFTEMVQKAVEVRIMELLSPEDGKELDATMEKHGQNSKEFASVLEQKIPNLVDLYKEETIKAKRALLENVKIPPPVPEVEEVDNDSE